MYKALRHRIKPWKSKGFLSFMKERFPDKDLHHLLGSVGPLKLTDLLVVPLSRQQHQSAHCEAETAFEDNLAEALNYVQQYITYLEAK